VPPPVQVRARWEKGSSDNQLIVYYNQGQYNINVTGNLRREEISAKGEMKVEG